MRNLRPRALRAAVFGVCGVFVVAPAAHAATCVHAGGGDGTATLTYAAGDGTVTLSQDDSGALTYAVGGGAAAVCGASTLTNSAQVDVIGSAGADTHLDGGGGSDTAKRVGARDRVLSCAIA